MQKFTKAELSRFNGRDGAPVYVSYAGQVYDLSESFLWEDGDHQGEHEAGRELTEAMAGAPHDSDMLEDFPVVGVLVEGEG